MVGHTPFSSIEPVTDQLFLYIPHDSEENVRKAFEIRITINTSMSHDDKASFETNKLKAWKYY